MKYRTFISVRVLIVWKEIFLICRDTSILTFRLKREDFIAKITHMGGSFIHYPVSELDKWEQYWILEYTKKGYQCRYNKTAGGQGEGKEKINEFKPVRGYRDGIQQGRKAMARELSSIAEKHLTIAVRPDKSNNKISQRQYEKFQELLKEGQDVETE